MNKKDRLELTVILSIVAALTVVLPVFAGEGGTYPSPYPAPNPAQGLAIAGVLVSALTALIVQGVKDMFSLEGSAVRLVAILTGTLLSGVALAIDQGMLGADAVALIRLAVLALCGGLGAPGAYSLYKMRNGNAS